MEVVRKMWVARARGQGREVELCLLDTNHCALQLHAHVLFRCAVFGIVRHAFFPLLRSKLPWWTAKRRMELALLSQPWWKASRPRQEDPAGCILVKNKNVSSGISGVCTVIGWLYTNEKSGSASHSPIHREKRHLQVVWGWNPVDSMMALPSRSWPTNPTPNVPPSEIWVY